MEYDSSKSNRSLKINAIMTNRVSYQKYGDFKDSFFEGVYEKAAEITLDIIKRSKSLKEENGIKEDVNFQVLNNIISFIGDRGVGKSSTMLSYAEFLKGFNHNKYDEKDIYYYIKEEKVSFITLDVIDPTLMNNGESIFEFVISKMFNKVLEYYKSRKSPENDKEIRELLKEFEKAYSNIKYVHENNRFDGGYIDALQRFTQSSNLRGTFTELVQKFLQHLDFDNDRNVTISPENRYLVISIDDLDMNIVDAFDFTEEIRKYLMIPNVIILMTFRYEQYKAAILNHYLRFDTKLQLFSRSKNYEDQVKYDKMIKAQTYIVREYMEKVFPLAQMITLPSINTSFTEYDYGVLVDYVGDNDAHNKILNGLPVKQFLYINIFDKTRIRFAYRYGKHPFDMNNLREFHNYTVAIRSRKAYVDFGVENEDKFLNYVNYQKNLDWFVDDIVSRWSMNKLEAQDVDFLHELQEREPKYKNVLIIKYFEQKTREYITMHKDRTNEIIEKRISRVASYAYPENVTLGRVIEVVNLYAKLDEDNEKLAFATLILYSSYLKRIEKEYQKNTGHEESLLKKIDEFTKDDFYESNSCYILPLIERKTQKRTRVIFGRIENTSEDTDKYRQHVWLKKLNNNIHLMAKYLKAQKGKNNNEKNNNSKNDPEKVTIDEIIELYRFEEMTRLFHTKENVDGKFDFNILNIFVSLMRYEKVFKEYRDKACGMVISNEKEKVKVFFEKISLGNKIKEWIDGFLKLEGESLKNKPITITMFPIYDLDYTSEMIKQLSYVKRPVKSEGEGYVKGIAEAIRTLFLKIYDYICMQDKMMFKDIDKEKNAIIEYAKVYRKCPIISYMNLDIKDSDYEKEGRGDFLTHLAEKIYPSDWYGYMKQSEFNFALHNIADTIAYISGSDSEEVTEEMKGDKSVDQIKNEIRSRMINLRRTNSEALTISKDNEVFINHNYIDEALSIFKESLGLLYEYFDLSNSNLKLSDVKRDIESKQEAILKAKINLNAKEISSAYELAQKMLTKVLESIRNIV